MSRCDLIYTLKLNWEKKRTIISLNIPFQVSVFLSLLAYYATFCDHFCLKEGKKHSKILSVFMCKKTQQKNKKNMIFQSLLFTILISIPPQNKQTKQKTVFQKTTLLRKKRSFFFKKSSRLFFSFFPLDTVLLTAFFFDLITKT